MANGKLNNKEILLFLVIVVHRIHAVSIVEQCASQDTCERCLGANLACAWCTDKQFDMSLRCLPRDSLIQFGCNEANIYENDPQSHLLMNTPLKDYETVNDRAVQLTPQHAYLKLVKSHPQRIKLSYRAARNNPLDLYVLMDLTWTMRDDKQTLVKLGANLTQTLSNLTPNYRLGFGSFADKPAMPMIMPQMRNNPCAAEGETCEPTYGYHHHMSLSTDVNDFIRSVDASRITGNLDNLEGGLDALMQVIVCPEAIGWKEDARKVVILVTDGFMHVAGDGLLAGITQRNDKRCHLSDTGEYLGSLQYDYPSLEEIYRELVKRKVNVIFAVTAEVINTYHELSGLMKEISNVELLSADSSNILELIKKSYESFIKRTQITDNSPEFIKVEYETDCGGHFSTLRKLSYCNHIELGQQVDFYVNVTLTDYPPDGVYTYKIRIEESSLNEYMEIDVELQKPCPCSEQPDPEDEYGRFECNDKGYLQCGSCICDDGWTGTNCNCTNDPTNATTNDMLNNMCRPGLSYAPGELGPICSNRGDCDCGSCICMPGYDGKYCECSACDDACDAESAECVCGQCQCKPGWSGKTCKCKESSEGCIGPTGEICSKRGSCQCDACVCDDPYLGNFCEIGSELDNKLCTFYEPCVACLIEQKQGLGICNNLTEICSSTEFDQRFNYAFVNEDVGIYSDVRCLVRITNKHGEKCDSYFTYESKGQSENYLRIQAVECEPINYVAFTGIIAAITFILGLIIICLLRAYFSLKDRREMARFEEDQRASVHTGNPIYRDPMRYYQVPKQLSRNYDENPFVD